MFAFLRTHSIVACALLLLLLQSVCAHAGEDWLPIAPEELKMTAEPKAPGAMAIYLYRQVDRDDVESRETTYARIKIFTEEGRKYADIEIPFVKGSENIKNIQARTVHPDGSIINFDGKTYEKTVVKAKGVKFLAKTFTMPDVQVGSIIEYRFTRILPEDYVFDSRWLLSEELFTRHARFSLHQNSQFTLQWSWPRGLPPGTNPPAMDHRVVRLETQDIPAFQIEDYMPPVDKMKYRVDFMYTRNQEKDAEKFWKAQAIQVYRGVDSFTDRHKAMEKAVAQIVSASDTAEQKLREIYARCQKIRNTTFEPEKTQQELDREKLKEIRNVEDVWKHGYGNGWDITWLFLALARAAGFDADPVLIATRDTHFPFSPSLMNPDDLNTNVVVVKLDGKDIYADPGVAFAPFEVLPWSETGAPGLRINKDGGSWITTTTPEAANSGVERKATFQLDEGGSLEGQVTLTFKGISALSRRIELNQEDAAERKKFLEDEMKSYVPVPAEVELTNVPDWASSSNRMNAEFHVKIPAWTSSTGKRTFVPLMPFGGGEKHLFEGETRVHPIYFDYPYMDLDDVSITPPSGLQISGLPTPQNTDAKAVAYGLTAEDRNGALHVTRRLMLNLQLVEVKYYGPLHKFFQIVRSGDEQQAVLSALHPPQ